MSSKFHLVDRGIIMSTDAYSNELRGKRPSMMRATVDALSCVRARKAYQYKVRLVLPAVDALELTMLT